MRNIFNHLSVSFDETLSNTELIKFNYGKDIFHNIICYASSATQRQES